MFCGKLAFWRPKKALRSAACWPQSWMNWCDSARDTTAREGAPLRGSAKDSISAGDALVHATNFMSDRFFVDTNILVYAHDRAAGARRVGHVVREEGGRKRRENVEDVFRGFGLAAGGAVSRGGEIHYPSKSAGVVRQPKL